MKKKCVECGLTKNLEFFDKNDKTEDGYRSKCKECRTHMRGRKKDEYYTPELSIVYGDEIYM